jgi:hypothetical protein
VFSLLPDTVSYISFATSAFAALMVGEAGVFPEREEIVLGGSGCCLSPFWLSRQHLLHVPDRFISAASEVISNRGRGFVNRRF